MTETSSIDLRLMKILQLLERYAYGNFSYRESYNRNGDEVDEIIRRLNALGEKIQQSGKLIANYEKRVTAIMNVLLKYTLFDFSEKAEISDAGDEIDAIALALNTLGEELQARVQTEARHTAELEKLAVVIETTADAVILMTAEGKVTHWNKSAERIFGYEAGEMNGKPAMELLADEEERTAIQQHMDKVQKGEAAVDLHIRCRHRSGKLIDLSLTLTPIVDSWQKVVSISAVARDITEQKRAEKILRESEERFRSLVESVNDYAIISLDRNGHIITWNEGARKIKGYNADEIVGKFISVFYTEEDAKAGLPQKYLQQAREHGRSSHEGYKRKKDGTLFWANVVISCMKDESGNILGFSKITRDLTETKRKDEAIREYTRELEKKNLELEKINNELASFAYISSHDLQEPLRKIQTLSSRIMQTDYTNLSDTGKNCFNRLENSANRMQQLLRDILDYTNLSDADKTCEDCDLNEFIPSVIDEFEDSLKQKQATVQITELCQAPVIKNQFRQLICQLLSNALKFSDESRKPVIRISSRLEKGEALKGPNGEEHSRYCHITFTDNGIGFEPHFNKQIFEVFSRLHSQDIYPGTGIGLAICKKIVENHQGVIRARGELGKGTSIDIYLPAEKSGEKK